MKKINANLYTLSKISFSRERGHYYVDLNGHLYSEMRYPTKLTPEDLPEHFVHGYYYRNEGYLSSRNVKYLVYKPNMFFNHVFKDDMLYISYDKPITEMVVPSFSGTTTVFDGYDYAISGGQILEFLEKVEKYSDFDTSEIGKKLIEKVEWFINKYPYDMEIPYAHSYLKRLKEKYEK